MWQGYGVTDATLETPTEAAAFNQVTKISVTTDALDDDSHNITVTQSGIVAFMADRYACMHTIRSERIIAPYFEPEDVTLYMYQNRDQYINNLAQNAIVFTLEEPVIPPVSQIRMNMKK